MRDDTGHSILQDALRESSSSSYGLHAGGEFETNNHQRETAKAEDKGADVEPALLNLSTAELLDRCHRFIAEAESRFQGSHMKCDEEDIDLSTGRQASPDTGVLGTTDDSDAVRRFKSELEKGKIIKIKSHGMSNGYFHVESSSKSDELLNKTLKASGRHVAI